VVGAADFNGDGAPDIYWQHRTSLQRAVWLMNDAAIVEGRLLNSISSRWGAQTVTLVGDFNGDGVPDWLLKGADGTHEVWIMYRNDERSADIRLPAPGTGWELRATADINADGRSDLVWQHVDGSVAVWLMDGSRLADGFVLAGPIAGWRIVAPR
jgi:hypothetical protein